MKNLFLTTIAIKTYTVVRDDSVGAAMREAGIPFAILGVLLILLGLLYVLRPKLAWKISHWGKRWMYRDAEPTDGAIIFMIVVGVIAILVGLFLAVFPFIPW
ncbi:MAG: hypothetical protein IKK61_01235 [Clostridia bacterium]|nr:hypothetical protein [Clostridia bacterium]